MYNYPVMSIQDWAGLVLTVLSIVVLLAGGIKFLVKHYLSELKTNGGSSMRDEIKTIKLRQDEADQLRREMNQKLDKMYMILIDYISNKKN